jgi:hypothetical protein
MRLPAVFASGDVRHGSVKRVARAVGEGAVAVGSARRYLMELAPPIDRKPTAPALLGWGSRGAPGRRARRVTGVEAFLGTFSANRGGRVASGAVRKGTLARALIWGRAWKL